MYHVKLIKGRSYTGLVSATQSKPDVYIKDEETVKKVLSTGYFEEVPDDPKEKGTASSPKEKEKKNVKPAEKKGEVNA